MSENRILPLAGYTNRLSARPGDSVEVKVSSLGTTPYHASLVRVLYADPNPDGPGVQEEIVLAAFAGDYPSREQKFCPGSCGVVEHPKILNTLNSFTAFVTIWPTIPGQGCQTMLAHQDGQRGWSLGLDENGQLLAQLGDGNGLRKLNLPTPLRTRQWCRVWLSYDADTKTATLGQTVLNPYHQNESGTIRETEVSFLAADASCTFGIAAQPAPEPCEHFNGKIEAPGIYGRSLASEELEHVFQGEVLAGLLAHWDFSREIPTSQIVDVGPNQLHGRLRNTPARGMTGSNWNATEMCWRHAPEEYGAIHFHDDDIYDFDWETDFRFTVPEDLRSGVYAVKLTCAGHEDRLPLFVLPPQGQRRAEVCVLVSTFTYAVYGNHARPDFHDGWRERIRDWKAFPHNPADYPQYGLSTYNNHSDGSGICFASHRRPLLNLRPGYLTFGEGEGSGLRHFQADSHLYAWLEAKGIAYDLITDQELHEEGVACLQDYSVLCTGSHPEYHTPQTLDALTAYRDQGGHFAYLGGNGFYWRVALSEETPGMIEIRRAEGGIRAWAAEPGEYYHCFDGAYGGLWRRSGRPPQKLAGVGFSAQGKFEGSYYRRTTASRNPELAWLFAGIEDEEILGDFGFCGGGAAGFELDRADTRLGTPESVQVVARSERHTSSFVLVPEEVLTHLTNWPGESEPNNLIRADMVYYETPSGGAVFSTGSITFCGSLPWNNFDNNISTLLENVLRHFLAEITT